MLDGTQAMTNLIENDKISKDQIDWFTGIRTHVYRKIIVTQRLFLPQIYKIETLIL